MLKLTKQHMITYHQHLSIQIHGSPHCIILLPTVATFANSNRTVNNTPALAKNTCKNLGFASQQILGAIMQFRNVSTVSWRNRATVKQYFHSERLSTPGHFVPIEKTICGEWNRRTTTAAAPPNSVSRDTQRRRRGSGSCPPPAETCSRKLFLPARRCLV